MPNVIFEPLDDRAPVSVDSPDPARLVDLCDANAAPIEFSCRGACCGTCRVRVLEGAELLEPPEEDELEVLEAFADNPAKVRLACQARLRPGAGTVRVRQAP